MPRSDQNKIDQHVASHARAERIYEHVLELIRLGHDPNEVRTAVRELHRRARENHQVLERDAFVEVLDALADE